MAEVVVDDEVLMVNVVMIYWCVSVCMSGQDDEQV